MNEAPKQDEIKAKDYSKAALFLILLVTVMVYYIPASKSELLNWDDQLYLTDNDEIKADNALRNIWIDNKMPNPYPITFTTLYLQYQLFGLDGSKYHFVNIAIHLINIILWWLLLRYLKLNGMALFAAVALYALHPVQVESVMWIAEVKNLLSALFYWLSFLAFLKFFEEGHEKAKKWTFYGLGVFTFICSLLSKSMTVTFPVSLTLWVFLFHRDSFMKKFTLLIPLYLLSLWCGIASMSSEGRYYTTRHQKVLDRDVIERVHDVTESLYFYLWKFFAPLDLACIYPQNPLITPKTWQSFLATFLLVALVLGLLWATRWIPKFSKLGAFCILNYGIVAGPILGFLSTSYMPLSKVSDRYNYHPLPFLALGVFLLLLPLWNMASRSKRQLASFVFFILFGIFCFLTYFNATVWSTSINLWNRTVEVNPRETEALYNLGLAYLDKGDHKNAEKTYLAALEVSPNHYKTNNNYGNLLAEQGRFREAIERFKKVNEHAPDMWMAHNGIAQSYQNLGKKEEAANHYQEVVKLKKAGKDVKEEIYYDVTCINLAQLLWQKGEAAEAEKYFKLAAEKGSNKKKAYQGLGLCFIGRDDQKAEENFYKAIEEYKNAPSVVEVWKNLYSFYYNKEQYQKALAALEKGLKSFAKDFGARKEYAVFHLSCPDPKFRNPKLALEFIQKLSKESTNDSSIFDLLAVAYSENGQFPEAIKAIRKISSKARKAQRLEFAEEMDKRKKMFWVGSHFLKD